LTEQLIQDKLKRGDKLPYVRAKNPENFKDWITRVVKIDQIKSGRFLVVSTGDNEFWVIPVVATQGLMKPFIDGLTESERKDISKWFDDQEIQIMECTHFYPDDREDPRKIKKEE